MDHAPTVQNYLILGDALLSIQEPADAILAFQQALMPSRSPFPAPPAPRLSSP